MIAPYKRFSLAMLCVMLAGGLAHGNTYNVTMTCTVTSTSEPLFHIGDTFTNIFHYESDSTDGTFYSQTYFNPHGMTPELFGQIYVPGDRGTAPSYNYTNMGFSSGTGWAYENGITVQNGVVTSFFFDWQGGDGNATYHTNTFGFLLSGASYSGITKGTVSFDNPCPTPANVPEGAATAGLLGLGLVTVAACRRIRRRLG